MGRSSGVLLHITSLPSDYGVGDLGTSAFEFVDILSEAGQSVWQILPTVPVGPGFSPYMSPSTFAGNPLLISPEKLLETGLVSSGDLHDVATLSQSFEQSRVEFPRVASYKKRVLQKAYDNYARDAGNEDQARFDAWCDEQRAWLHDYALFETLKHLFPGQSWTTWPPELIDRHSGALDRAREEHASTYRQVCFEQFLFSQQWAAFRSYANQNGVSLFGDLPIYIAPESADVWSHPELFQLDSSGKPVVVAGVPPDYFSETGQYWGNPIYNWDAAKSSEYDWWKRRLENTLHLVDLIRLDHFRGFEAYWEVPAEEETAVNGRWVKGPGADLFYALKQYFGEIPIIAEDLGVMTEEVKELMKEFGIPGMAILQFALDGEMDEAYLPHNLTENIVAYTGTHDNDTFVGWWQNRNEERDPLKMDEIRAFTNSYLHLGDVPESEIAWKAIESLMASEARTVIIPIQDILGLPGEARMNTPGSPDGNWQWRLRKGQLHSTHINRLGQITRSCGRTNYS